MKLSRFVYLFFRDRIQARQQYKKSYGLSPEDTSIEDELEQIALTSLEESDGESHFRIPSKLLFALLLRPRGRGKGRKHPDKEIWAKRQRNLIARLASIRWVEIVLKDGIPPKRAKHQAAIETIEEAERSGNFKYGLVSVGTLKGMMRFGQGKIDFESR